MSSLSSSCALLVSAVEGIVERNRTVSLLVDDTIHVSNSISSLITALCLINFGFDLILIASLLLPTPLLVILDLELFEVFVLFVEPSPDDESFRELEKVESNDIFRLFSHGGIRFLVSLKFKDTLMFWFGCWLCDCVLISEFSLFSVIFFLSN